MDERTQLADDIANHYERLGLSSTAARVLGVLVLEPSGLADAPTLAARLGVAKSSMSVALTTLERYGLVTRSRTSRNRREEYTIAPDAFEAVFLSKFPALEAFLALADRGVALAEPGSESEQRLRRMRAFYAFMLQEFPAMLSRWKTQAEREFGPTRE